MQVCNCNGVSKGAIMACVKAGKRTAQERDGGHACRHGLRRVQRPGRGDRRRGRAAAQAEVDPASDYYVPSVPLSKPELILAIREAGLRTVSAVFEVLGDGSEDAGSKPALASLLNTLWADEYVDERDARFINDRVHANIQKDGTFTVIPQMPGGVTSAAQLRRIADVADKYNVPLVKLTGGQRIDLVGVAQGRLPKVWRDLDMPSGLCVRQALPHLQELHRHRLLPFRPGRQHGAWRRSSKRRFQGIDTPGKLKLATAGCPRNCSEAMVKDIGAVAVEGGKWEIYIGGAAGAHVRKGDLLMHGRAPMRTRIKYMGRFMQYYRENAATWSAPTASSSASASPRSARSWWTTAKASPNGSTLPCRSRSTRTSTPGAKPTHQRRKTSSKTSCPSCSDTLGEDQIQEGSHHGGHARPACIRPTRRRPYVRHRNV